MTPINANSSGVGSSACTGSSPWTASKSSLEECKQKCLADSDCNTFNYCDDGAVCPTYSLMVPYCTFKKCTGKDYMLTSTEGIFNIYTKMNGIFEISQIKILICTIHVFPDKRVSLNRLIF